MVVDAEEIQTTLESLPHELMREVLRACDERSVFLMQRVNRTWRGLVSGLPEDAWAAIFTRAHPREAPLLLPRLGRSRALIRAFGKYQEDVAPNTVVHLPDVDFDEEPVVMLVVGKDDQPDAYQAYIMDWDDDNMHGGSYITMSANLPARSVLDMEGVFQNMLDMENTARDWAFNDAGYLQFHVTTACYVFVPVGAHDIRLFVLWRDAHPQSVEVLDTPNTLDGRQSEAGDVLTYAHGICELHTPCVLSEEVAPTSMFPSAARHHMGDFEGYLEFRPVANTLVRTEPYLVSPCLHYLVHASISFGLGVNGDHPDSVLTEKSEAIALLQGLYWGRD